MSRRLMRHSGSKLALVLVVVTLLSILGGATVPNAQTSTPVDPGVRGGAPGAGDPLAGLTARELDFFLTGKDDFQAVEEVADGLGPPMNLDSCAGCHAQPATGGTSPFLNPQVAFASKDGGLHLVP